MSWNERLAKWAAQSNNLWSYCDVLRKSASPPRASSQITCSLTLGTTAARKPSTGVVEHPAQCATRGVNCGSHASLSENLEPSSVNFCGFGINSRCNVEA